MFHNFKGMNRHSRRAAMWKLRKETARRECSVTTHELLRRKGSDFLDRYAALLQRFGYPPHDQEIAVAHEAGHLVVGAAFGGACTRAYVRQDQPGVWSGYNAMAIPGVNDRTFRVGNDAPRAEKWATYLVAGIAAEMAFGRFHPASSFEEATRVAELAAAIGAVEGKDLEVVAAGLFSRALNTIRVNSEAFEAVRATFAYTD
jgi:hypothetical protein